MVEILGWIWRATRKLSVGAIVAHRPIRLAWQDAGVPVVSIADVASMPRESHSIAYSVDELLVGSAGIGIAHVVQDTKSEWSAVACCECCLETEHLRSSRAIGSRNQVVVLCIRLQIRELDIVVVLAALSYSNLGARRRAIIPDGFVLVIARITEICTYVVVKPVATLFKFFWLVPQWTVGLAPNPNG